MNSPTASENPDPGRRLGHYEIREKLGSGGMGSVYLAFDTRLNRNVALKVLGLSPVEGTGGTIQLLREAQAASALNHPNIVTVYEVGRESDIDFIAMEHVAGKTLDKFIGRRMALREMLPILIQIADALGTAHAAGIVHRDLKPGNVMVTERGLVKVLDFGIAKVRQGSGSSETHPTETMTEMGKVHGTVAYMSPEQAEGKEVDGRSDIFAFGCVLYELLTGHRAFEGETEMATLAAVMAKDPRPLRELAPGVPRSLEHVLEHCLRKKRAERWQLMDDIKLVLEGALADLDAASPPPARSRRWPVIAAAAGAAIVAAGVSWWWLRPAPPEAPSVLQRVTNTNGLNGFPAISRDGNLLAFASDRSEAGNLDIWIQQIGSRDSIRLTTDEADDSEPTISPDGTRVAWRSERNGGGIYVVPSMGGEAALLAPGGRGPRFSPDGHWIAYWAGRESQGLLPGTSRVFVIESGGGQPRQLGMDLAVALYPVWSPEGDAVLALGRHDANDPRPDWWTLQLQQGASRRTGALESLSAQRLTRMAWQMEILPVEWRPDGRVVFGAGPGDAGNLWQIELAGGKVKGRAARVTEGPGLHVQASTAGSSDRGRMAFSSLAWKPEIWSLSLDADRGTIHGEPERVMLDEPSSMSPSLSTDGKYLAFLRRQLGRTSICLRELPGGRDVSLVTGTASFYNPRISGDGSTVAYSDREGNIFTVPRTGGPAEKLCAGCGTTMGISADGKRISYEPGKLENLTWYDVARKTSVIAAPRPSEGVLTDGKFSPDGKWIAFHAQTRQATAQIFVTRTDGALPVPREGWIAVTDGANDELEPAWSPNGELLYYLSDRDGFRCIWARRVDRATGMPAGEAFGVAHFHRARRSLKRMTSTTGLTGLSVAPGRMVFSFGELTGNIWLLEKVR
ncbi:MAG: serine/threonine protein kinase [Candidatus Solibacter sp.]|nr:serine/threonine protein kinase [Candidatus Solibacter sp.]